MLTTGISTIGTPSVAWLKLTVVDTIEGAFGFWRPKRDSKKKIFISWKRARRELSCDVVHLIIALVIIYLSFDLYLYVARVSMEITDHTNGNSSFSERNKGDVAKFHEPARKPMRSETKSDDDNDGTIEDELNICNAPTTDASPNNFHGRDVSANETSPRRSKGLSFQNKLDDRDARKYIQTDKENFSNDETLSDNDSLIDGSDDKFILSYKRKKGDSEKKGDSNYGSNDEKNEKGGCHENRNTPMHYMRRKGGKKGGSIWKYVRCDIVDDEFEAKAVIFVKSRRPRALTREERLDILMLQI